MQRAGTPSFPAASRAPLTTPKSKPKRYRHSFWWYLKWFFNIIALVIFCGTVAVIAIGKGLYDEMGKLVPDVRFMQARNKTEATRVYAADGSLLATLKSEQRQYITIDQLKVAKKRYGKWQNEAGNLMNATVSIEDARFYTHPGIDAKRIIKAAYVNAKSGEASQGGSTITEQLAKNVYLTRTKTIGRRLQTALLALQLERRLTKDEILELYLNEIPYGNRVSGCEAAAQTYFNKGAKDLNIPEAALLAGLPQAPSTLDPFQHFDRAQRRQHIVLHEMWDNKKISWGQYQNALKDTKVQGEIAAQRKKVYAERRQRQHWRAPYFVSYVLQYLQKQYGWGEEYLAKSGLKIYTTLDPDMQSAADDEVRTRLANLPARRGMYLQSALVCIDPWTGNVLAMVGGRDYYDTAHNGEFNRATQAHRQPGSTFKPYVYSAAMEAGYTPNSIVVDAPLSVCGDGPCPPGQFKRGHNIKNYDFKYRGPLTFKQAIGMSNNVAASRVLLKLGIPTVIEKAHLMGIETSLVPVPTLALGVSEVTPLEHTSAYGAFSTRGLRAEETPIMRIDNPNGQTIVQAPSPVQGARVLSPTAANEMHDMLRYVVTNGTGKVASIPGVDVIGKTGTTSSNKDVWFMGATPQLVTGVWIGYDRPVDLGGHSAGGKWCAPVWRGFMVRALDIWGRRHPIDRMVENARATDLQRLRAAQFKNIVKVKICDESGLLANSACPHTHYIVLSTGENGGAPTRVCDIHKPQQGKEKPLDDGVATVQPGDLDYNPPDATDGNSSVPSPDDAPIPTGDDVDPTQPTPTPEDSSSSGRGASAGGTSTRRSRRPRSADGTAVTSPTTSPDTSGRSTVRRDRSRHGGDEANYDPDAPIVLDGQSRTEADNPMNGER